MARYIALLRGINVSGRKKVPMAELRDLCASLGWREVQTCLQSGNVAFSASGKGAAHEAQLEESLTSAFGLRIPVIVRSAAAWDRYRDRNPFVTLAGREPNRVMLALSKAPPVASAVADLQARAADGERIERNGDALWVHFPGDVGRSKLTPALLDRLVGSPVTMRNWRTVQKLHGLIRG